MVAIWSLTSAELLTTICYIILYLLRKGDPILTKDVPERVYDGGSQIEIFILENITNASFFKIGTNLMIVIDF